MIGIVRQIVKKGYHSIKCAYCKMLDKTFTRLIMKYVERLPYNPKAGINRKLVEGSSGVTPLRTDNDEDIGLVQVRHTPTLKGYLAILYFAKKGGKLIYMPMWAGLPRPEEVRMYSAAGYATLEPANYLKIIPTIPLTLTDLLPIGRFYPLNIDKKYDFIIVTWVGDIRHKRWDVVLKLIEKLCPAFKMVVIAYRRGNVNKKDSEIIDRYTDKGQLTFVDTWVSKAEFPKILNQSKVMVVPNEWDNHPRVIDQALLCNVPLAVNRNIYGGKKLITETTGRFAAPEKLCDCAVWVLENLAEKKIKTREWYLKNHGPYNAIRKYTQFINNIFDVNYKVVYPEDREFMLKKEYASSIGDLPYNYDGILV